MFFFTNFKGFIDMGVARICSRGAKPVPGGQENFQGGGGARAKICQILNFYDFFCPTFSQILAKIAYFFYFSQKKNLPPPGKARGGGQND